MGAVEMVALCFTIMFALMFLRIPVAAAMFVAGAVGYCLQAGPAIFLSYLNGAAYARFSVYDLSQIPLFMLMGQFASQGGISRDLFDFANRLLARSRGGMAMATVVSSGIYGSVCGSSVATVATVASVAMPEMRRAGYSGRLATGTIAAGGTLGLLLPPSIILVVYGIMTEQNITKLFAASIVPGVIALAGYMASVAIYVRLRPDLLPADVARPAGDKAGFPFGILPIIVVFVLVFGGIYGGYFTPTEAAGVGALSTFVIALVRGELNRTKFTTALLDTATTSGFIFMILIGADVLNAALALTQATEQLAAMVAALPVPPLVIIGAILLFYIVLGSVMDEMAMIMLTIPIVFPMVMGLDLGLPPSEVAIWFGILVLMVVGVGMILPPVGLNVYVINGIAKDVPMLESYKGVVPFLISDFVRIALVLLFPAIALVGVDLFVA